MGHTRYSGYKLTDENMEVFVRSCLKNKVLQMPKFDSDGSSEGRIRDSDCLNENAVQNKDLLMEQILENINTTPIGQVLKKIASLPEVRREKVLDIRRQLTEGKYDLNERLDIALEKVLDDLVT